MTSWFKVSVTSLRPEALQTQYKVWGVLLHCMQQRTCWTRELHGPSLPTQPLQAALQKLVPYSQSNPLPQKSTPAGSIQPCSLTDTVFPYSFLILILIWMECSFSSRIYPSHNIHTRYLHNSSNGWTCVQIWDFFCSRHNHALFPNYSSDYTLEKTDYR